MEGQRPFFGDEPSELRESIFHVRPLCLTEEPQHVCSALTFNEFVP